MLTILSGNRAAGLRELGSQALTNESDRIDQLLSQVDEKLHVRFPAPASGTWFTHTGRARLRIHRRVATVENSA